MKFFLSLFLWIVSFLSISQSFATGELLTREEALIFLAETQKSVPESFQYINLQYQDIEKDSPLEDALQKLIYLNSIKNSQTQLSPQTQISQYELYTLAQTILKSSKAPLDDSFKSIPATQDDITDIKELLAKGNSGKISISLGGSSNSTTMALTKKEKVLFDVYNTLMEEHYEKESFTEDALIEWAIKGITNEIGDTYTTYFPAVESSSFFQALDGEYEGIWAYVEMPSPGNLIIISPIVGSPSEAAGVKGGDIVTHIDGKEITAQNTLSEVVSWIKGPAGSDVELTILRDGNTTPLKINVTRAKIILKDVEYKKINNTTFYIQIKNFWEKVDTEFLAALQVLKDDTRVKKVIIDVRNNPGGYLNEVSDMLSYFVPAGEATAIVSSGENDMAYRSHGYDFIDMSQYSFVLIQNGGSASASEILVGTIKDYYPEATIIGEKSFGKGSVQSLKNYYDGSTLKYTSAKWFTGKTRQWIDKIGIQPDILLEFDGELFEKSNIDNQLQEAIDYKKK